MQQMQKVLSTIFFTIFIASLLNAQSSKEKPFSKVERRILDTITKLKEVRERIKYVDEKTKGKRHLAFVIWEKPTQQNPYYWVKVTEDNGMTYYTHFNFFVYPQPIIIKFLDTANDNVTDLKTWRKRKY